MALGSLASRTSICLGVRCMPVLGRLSRLTPSPKHCSTVSWMLTWRRLLRPPLWRGPLERGTGGAWKAAPRHFASLASPDATPPPILHIYFCKPFSLLHNKTKLLEEDQVSIFYGGLARIQQVRPACFLLENMA